MHLIYHNSCRLCHSFALTKVIDLGNQYLQNVFVKPGKIAPSMRKIPMILLRCNPMRDENACGLLQLAYTIPSEILYSTYWYRSGTNQTMRLHLKNIADKAQEMIAGKNLKVLDIGCNDGTLLSYYHNDCIKVGIDPSNAVKDIKENILIIQDLFPSVELEKKITGSKFDIITSIAMFYDTENPLTFAERVKKILSPQGLWIFELFYLPDMLTTGAYDTICHEHLSYYSLSVIEYFLKKTGMKLINISLNKINGGSLCCFVTHSDNFKFKKYEDKENLQYLRQKEFDSALDTDQPYLEFQNRILKHKEKLSSMLRDLKRKGKKIHVYGASTKGNTLLQFCNLDNTIIDYAADRNPQKFGAYTLGTNIPIISEEKSRAMKPDYYLVLPWSFKDEFLQREKKLLEQGTRMIFSFPNIEITEKL